MSSTQIGHKLRYQAHVIKISQQRERRHKKARGVDAAKRAHERQDVRKFIMEVNYVAAKGCLDTRKIMWSYVQDVVHAEYLRLKGSGKYSKGMR